MRLKVHGWHGTISQERGMGIWSMAEKRNPLLGIGDETYLGAIGNYYYLFRWFLKVICCLG